MRAAAEMVGAKLKRINWGHGEALEGHHRGDKLWQQTFTRGYVEQCFRRTCVRELLLVSEENAPYLQAADSRLLGLGKPEG